MPPAPSFSHCPRCRTATAWDGEFCDHCHYPYPRRSRWDRFCELARFAETYPEADERPLYRFVIGCIRRAWHLLRDPDARHLVNVAEQYAERTATFVDVADAAGPVARTAEDAEPNPLAEDRAAATALEAIRTAVARLSLTGGAQVHVAVVAACRQIRQALALERVPFRHRWEYPLPPGLEVHRPALTGLDLDDESLSRLQREDPDRARAYTLLEEAARADAVRRADAEREEEARQCELYRDVVRYPFSPYRFDPGWPSSTVVALADGIHQDQAFDRLPLLGDALEDAGCDDREMLDHCRAERLHVRGCWVLELCRMGKADQSKSTR